jgi:hypothetical protein
MIEHILSKTGPIEISVEAPIGYIWLVAFPKRIKNGVNPIPNTEIYTYQQNLKTMAEIHHSRQIIVYYFGNVTEEQISLLFELTELRKNIEVVDFFSIDWDEYNFSFLYNGENTSLLNFLMLDNGDNLIGLRKDIAEHMLLLFNPKGIIFLDFDNKILEPIHQPLETSVGLLCGWDYDMNNRFDFFVNNCMVVSGPKNPILVDAFNELETYLHVNGIDTEASEDQFTLTSENVKFKNLHTFTGEWKLVLLMCDLQCCSLVSALCEKFDSDAFDKELIKKAESTTAFKRVLNNVGNFLSIESDTSRTWMVDTKYETVFNNMYNTPQLPLKQEFRGTINFDETNLKPLEMHIIVSSKSKFNMVNQFIKLNPDRKVFVYTFLWITVPKHFKREVIILENYVYNLSVVRLAMVDILYSKGGICWAMQHNPNVLPKNLDSREMSCLPGCNGKLCGAHICFDLVAVDRPNHKILCEVKELITQYKKYFNVTLNQHLYFDTHPNYVEYTYENGTRLSEKLIDTILWYCMSGYTPIARDYSKKVSFEQLVVQTNDLVVVVEK